MSNVPKIDELFELARAQMAAEAILQSRTTGVLATSGDALATALRNGNTYSSKFSESDAAAFSQVWVVLDHVANDKSGFSGTLLKNQVTHQLVLSFRSTEFADDAARDNIATNSLEIKDTGFAWGQLADMETWYAKLRSDPEMLKDKSFTVTGYSLGGHLATAFNQMHGSEANAVTRVVTFNGAGVGQLKFSSDSSKDLVNEFRQLRSGGPLLEDKFLDANLKTTYREVRQILDTNTWNSITTIEGRKSLLAQARTALNGYSLPSDPQFPQREEMVTQLRWISTSLDEIEQVATEAERVDKLSSGGTPSLTPFRVPDSQIAAENLDYRMAVKFVSLRTEAASLLGGGVRAYGSKVTLPSGQVANQFDVVGDTTPSMVSHSQWHIGKDLRVFIEDQPLVRGGYVASALGASLDNRGVELLVDNFAIKDFGDTHSLVLLVDSLAVQNTLIGSCWSSPRPRNCSFSLSRGAIRRTGCRF